MSVELKFLFKKEIYLKGILFAQYIVNEHEAELNKQKRLYVTESLIKNIAFNLFYWEVKSISPWL